MTNAIDELIYTVLVLLPLVGFLFNMVAYEFAVVVYLGIIAWGVTK